MTRQEVWMDIKLMHRQGASIREIARRTGLSRVTVRKILSQKAPKPYTPRPKRPGLLEPFTDRLTQALEARPWAKA
jgi:transposase